MNLREKTGFQHDSDLEKGPAPDGRPERHRHFVGTVGRARADGAELDAPFRFGAGGGLAVPPVRRRIVHHDVAKADHGRSRRVLARPGRVAAEGDVEALLAVRRHVQHLATRGGAGAVVVRGRAVRELRRREVVLDETREGDVRLAARLVTRVRGRDAAEDVGGPVVLGHGALVRAGHAGEGRRPGVVHLAPAAAAFAVELEAPQTQILHAVGVWPGRRGPDKALQELVARLVVPQIRAQQVWHAAGVLGRLDRHGRVRPRSGEVDGESSRRWGVRRSR